MLDLIELALEADRLAREARGARCCDALVPCRACVLRRDAVRARRLLLKVPRPRRRTAPKRPAATSLVARLAS